MIISDDCFCIIILFLTKKDLQTLVNAFSNCEKNRYHEKIIENILKMVSYKRLQVCSWTHRYGMYNLKESVIIQNIKYVSEFCKDLIIWNEHRNYSSVITIKKKYLEKLHIDTYNSRRVNLTLECPNLKILNIINILNLNEEMLNDILQNCQKLQKIFISYSGKIENAFLDSLKNNKPELKIVYHERLSLSSFV